ncbi:MAG: hypothetical protein HFJ60_04805 [Clostridia bacterium]|jgi:hypothetical protein|nr:hypothetical protein [Clostridia bacterium]
MRLKEENYEAKINNREDIVEDLLNKNSELTQENLVVHGENKYLRFENEEQKDLINNIIKELYSNVKTDEQKISKLKELISDRKSEN